MVWPITPPVSPRSLLAKFYPRWSKGAPLMILSGTHRTNYRYDCPVLLEPHIFRLQPRMSSTQRLLAFEIEISPKPAGTSECLDQDGNLALNAWFSAPTSELRVVSRFTVEMLRQNPFDYVL